VTVSCTVSLSILDALLASRATCQMNTLTRNHLLSLYADMTRKKMGLLAWPAVSREASTYSALVPHRPAPLAGYTEIRTSTAKFKAGCRAQCPREWRQMAGLKWVGVYAWNGFVDAVPFEDDRTLWRIGDACENKRCPNRGSALRRT
jgi:hypothetical protein